MAIDVKQAPTTPATHEEHHPRRFEPFDLLDEIEREFGGFFTGPIGRRPRFFQRLHDRYRIPEGEAWAPRLDEFEADGHLVIRAELPGVDRKDIKVTMDDGDIVIEGERRSESEVKEKDYYRMERLSGSFYRRLPLPEGIETGEIQATYKDGVLEVRVPKAAVAPATPAKQIPVK